MDPNLHLDEILNKKENRLIPTQESYQDKCIEGDNQVRDLISS